MNRHTFTLPALAVLWAAATCFGVIVLASGDAVPGAVSRQLQIVVVCSVVVHVLAAWRTSRARAAICGGLGGAVGAVAGAAAATALGAAEPVELGADGIGPLGLAGVAATACALVAVRALLAHVGWWRYQAGGTAHLGID